MNLGNYSNPNGNRNLQSLESVNAAAVNPSNGQALVANPSTSPTTANVSGGANQEPTSAAKNAKLLDEIRGFSANQPNSPPFFGGIEGGSLGLSHLFF